MKSAAMVAAESELAHEGMPTSYTPIQPENRSLLSTANFKALPPHPTPEHWFVVQTFRLSLGLTCSSRVEVVNRYCTVSRDWRLHMHAMRCFLVKLQVWTNMSTQVS